MMKKLLSVFTLLFAFSFVFAAESNSAPDKADTDWTPFQICFFPQFPMASYNSTVYGIKSGWPMCSGIGSVTGLEVSWLYSGTANIRGIQGSWIANNNDNMDGLQASWIFNRNTEVFYGFQASCILNMAGDLTGVQAGGLNIADGITGLQPGLLGNITGKMNGCQLGLFNVADEMNGFQASAVNVAGESSGFQLGFVNVAKKGVFQFGLVNVIEDGWLPFLPFFNFSF